MKKTITFLTAVLAVTLSLFSINLEMNTRARS